MQDDTTREFASKSLSSLPSLSRSENPQGIFHKKATKCLDKSIFYLLIC